MRSLSFLIPFFCVALLSAPGVKAQIIKPKTNEPRPKAILVELSSEKRKVDYYAKTYPEKANHIQRDAENIRQVTINDFRDRFRFCRVYFFMDTNAQFILDRNFSGFLLDTSDYIAKNIILTSQDTNYYIAIFGNALSDPKPTQIEGASAQDPSYLMGKGLVLYDYKFEQISTTLYHYVWKLDWWEIFGKPSVKYGYKSKEFNLEYFPSASKLDKGLKSYFDE